MPDARKIILDCDPGHDDAVAIMLALGSPAIDVLGITTVSGNQTLTKVTRNARGVLVMCGREDVPVYAGAPRPLVRAVQVSAAIHGETGLDGVDLPEPSTELSPDHAVDFIIEEVMSNPPGTITLVGIGPLTNLALATRLRPEIVSRVREVVIMGGGYSKGNQTAMAEFNIWADPEAAHIVFGETWPVTMVGLELTHQAVATAQVEDRVRRIGSDLSEFFAGMMGFFRAAYVRTQGFADPPVHDPCTIAYLIDPTIVATRRVPVSVELRGEHTTGMTVADFRTPPGPDCHTQVATTLDHERFWDLVVNAIRTLS